MLFIRRFLALILAIVGLLGFDFSAAELNFDNAIVSEKRDYRFDNDRLLIDADGNRTNTYYAVQTVNNEIAPFKELYADFEHIGTFLTNGGRAVGTNSGYLTPMTEEKGCCLLTTAPVLTGCFKKEDARAYVL